MSIEAIQGLTSIVSSSSSTHSMSSFASNEVDGANFANLLGEKLSKVNESIEIGTNTFESYVKGENVAVHDVMLAMGKAKSELQLVVEVRNKILEAYQEITRIQV